MKTSNLYRQVPGLLVGVTLFVISFLFSGCNTGPELNIPNKDLIGTESLPSIVLAITGHDYEFNWDKATLGGKPMSELVPKRKFWRLNIFKFSDDVRVGGNNGDFHSFEKRSEEYRNLPWNELLRVDLDLTDNPEDDPEAKTLSFLVLLNEDLLSKK
jgi:hypothetical protein